MAVTNYLKSGGLNLSNANATTNDVLSGKTFYAGNNTLKTGTIQTYSGATTVTENGTLETAGKYVESDITINVSGGDYNIDVTYNDDGTQSLAITDSGGESSNKLAQIIERTATEITAEDLAGVTSIGNNVFYSYKNLTNITLPSNLKSIGIGSFYGCTGLTNITIPNSVTNISGMAFSGCTGLISVTLPDNLTSIKQSIFSNCSKITSMIIPNSVTIIEGNVFQSCKSLTSITIPNSVTSIGMYPFNGCTGLTRADIYATSSTTKVNSSSYGWFYGCKSTLKLHIPSTVTNPTSAYGAYWNYYSGSGKLTYYADL